MKRATLFLMLLLPAPAMAQATSPSFDCARARAWDERAICADRDLAALDRRIAEAFGRAMEATPAQRESLQTEQRNFLRARRACDKPASGTPQACLRSAMAARATTLESGMATGVAPPAPPPAPPAVTASAPGAALRPVECGRDTSWAAQRICADPALRRLDMAVAQHVATLRQRLGAQPAPLREFETALTAHLRQRQDCARPIGRIPEDCILETLEDANRDWGRLIAAPAPPQRVPVSPAPAAR